MTTVNLPKVSFPLSRASELVAAYLGDEEEDVNCKEAVVRHELAGRAGLAPDYLARTCFDWTKRPANVVREATMAFTRLGARTDNWGVYGEKHYYDFICEERLLKTLIQQAPKGRKDFYVLDVGAGDFTWGKNMAEFLDAQKDLPTDITVHIINVGGEKYDGEKIVTSGRCKLYRLGQFKVEELARELERCGLAQAKGCFDLVISRLCVVHLIDPVGTFVQVYNILRPETGIFLGDGFHFFHEEEELSKWRMTDKIEMELGAYQRIMASFREKMRTNMSKLLIDLKAPSIMTEYNDAHRFIVRRLDHFPCELSSLDYGTLVQVKKMQRCWTLGPQAVCKLKRIPQPYDHRIKWTPDDRHHPSYRGTKDLYDWLNGNQLLEVREWRPLLEPADADGGEA